MDGKMWFGIPGSYMAWVPCPQIDSVTQRNRYIERLQFENGGGDARRSAQYQMEYQLNIFDDAHTVDGVDVYNKFASGFYGDGLIYMAYPTNFETNVLPAARASPSLIEEGWANIATSKPTFGNTNVSSYRQPRRTPTWRITDQANTYTKSTFIAIPPTHTLNLGVSGLATGSGVVRVRPVNTDGSYAAPQELTLLSKSGSTRMNTTFAGSEFQAVEIYITRTDDSDIERFNLVPNPSFENDVVHWTGVEASLSQSLDESYYGEASALVVASSGGLITSDPMAVNSSTYTASAWLKGEVGKFVKIGIFQDPTAPGGSTFSDSLEMTGDWQRVSVTLELEDAVESAIIAISNATDLSSHSFYVDGVLFEESESLGQYFDGFSPSTPDVINSWVGSSGDSASVQTIKEFSTVSITSMMGQLHKTGGAVSLPQDHYTGEGSTGLMFADEALVETYTYMYPPLKAISTILVEVGAWR